jgi:hypothetical protein
MTLLPTAPAGYLLRFLLMPAGISISLNFAIIEPRVVPRDEPGTSKLSRDDVAIPVIAPLTEEAKRLTRLRAWLLQPVDRQKAAMIHPVNGYELVEQAVTQHMKSQTIPVRPFAADTRRHIFHHHRIAPNFVLPVESAG